MVPGSSPGWVTISGGLCHRVGRGFFFITWGHNRVATSWCFKISTVEGVDDYAAIREGITRRYRYAAEGEELYPDVILIDGGLGQLHAGLEAFSEMDVRPPMVISLAKREEEIFVTGKNSPLKLPRTSPALKLLQYVRDESHRFAQHYHHILLTKNMLDEKN